MNKNFLPTFVGEWCLAYDDCAEWLNGFKIGTRADELGVGCHR